MINIFGQRVQLKYLIGANKTMNELQNVEEICETQVFWTQHSHFAHTP